MLSNHTCLLLFSHTPNSGHQEIMFFYLGNISKNESLLNGFSATALAWVTTIFFIDYSNNFPYYSPYIYICSCPSKSNFNIAAKNSLFFFNLSSVQNYAVAGNFSHGKRLCPLNDLQVSPFLASCYLYYLHSYNIPGLT